MTMFYSGCRLLTRSLLTTTPRYVCRTAINRRNFSQCRPLRAAEHNGPLMDAVRNSSLFHRLQTSPEAVESITRLGKILQDAGIDPGQPPSKMQLMKLAMNTQIRTEFMQVMESLKNAGVDLTSPEVQEEMKAIMTKASSGGSESSS